MRMTQHWSIQQIAKLAGTTSRTLRHYGDIGLLSPSRVGGNGYRYYDADALLRLQHILLLRELGLGLPAIAASLEGDDAPVLGAHLRWLESERRRIDRQIASVATTIKKLHEGEELMAEDMFDGFDHTAHRREVEQRWGAAAYAAGDVWWRTASEDVKRSIAELAQSWRDAASAGIDPLSAPAQELARRQCDWLSGVPGTPPMSKQYLCGLAELYVADERFAANYGGLDGARFVRDALEAFADARW
ncbi:TipAS antibiotic-recognition domain-containing protein [soil metagenome]